MEGFLQAGNVFYYGWERPVNGERTAFFQVEEAAFVSGFEVLNGIVADIAQGGGGVCHFQGQKGSGVIEAEAGGTHVGEELAAGLVAVPCETGQVIDVLVYGAVAGDRVAVVV